ncbi:TPA: LPXTG cell wall anchor domain-containing protein, partial [Streptococcus pneumoniae]
YKAPLAQQALPETGNKESDLLASLGLTAFFLGLFTLGKKREQ